MKNIAWNILAVLALLAIIVLAFGFLTIYSNPNSSLNPYPPPTVPANVVIPSSTMTPIFLPATWTPQPLAQTEIRSSSTLIPSATIYNLKTGTLTATPTPTPSEISPSFVNLIGTPTAYKYFCEISVDKPLDGGMVDYALNFDGQWTIKNGGTATWDSARVEARYITGTKLQTKSDTVKLPRDIPAGSSVRLSLDMTAPSDVGTYFSTWGLMEGNTVICRWTFAIRIPKGPPSPTPTPQ